MQSPRLFRNLRRRRGRRRSPRAVLRAFFTENFTLKVFAVALAVLMWAYVVSQRRGEATEIKFTTPLVLKNIPNNLEVTSAPVQAVSVLISVNEALADSVNPSQFQVGIDLTKQLPGSFEYTLGERNISYNNQPPPPMMQVLQISPSTVPITLEETIRREVPIKPRFSGELAQGYTMESVQIQPENAAIRGPRSHVEELGFIYTRPLDVEALSSDVEMLAELDLPPTVRLVDQKNNFFRARITVSSNPMRLLLRDIPVIFENSRYVYKTSTDTVNVFLEGPRDVVKNLNKENTFAVVDMSQYPPGDYRGLTPRVILPETVKVLEQWPIIDLFVIDRQQKKAG